MIIKGKKVLINNKFEDSLYLQIRKGKIINIWKKYEQKPDFEFAIIAPGLIDNHTHGAGGHDFMEANELAYRKILKTKVKSGTTSLFATSVTQSKKALLKMVTYTANHCFQDGEAQILGVHLEGPFISKIKKGAQPEKYIISPDVKFLDELNIASKSQVKVITYAPEEPGSIPLVKYCHKNNIKAQIGHTIATSEDLKKAFANGASGITHVYNAMPKSLKNETSGIVARSQLYGEIICDGVHNTYQQIEDFIDLKKVNKTLLITDSLMCAGCDDGQYLLGGEKIHKKGLEVRLEIGNIAGSVAGMIDVVKNVALNTKFSLAQSLLMGSTNVANYHNLKNKGRIEIGYDADLIGLSQDINLEMTMILGKIVHQGE